MINKKHNFTFITDRHNYWPIYEAIKKYYPIGLETKLGDGIYYEYPGLKALEEMIADNVQNATNVKSHWADKINRFSDALGNKIQTITYLRHEPSYSAHVILERHEIGNHKTEKKLNFAVSMVGPFYTIFGSDSSIYITEDLTGSSGARPGINQYTSNYRMVVSPYQEFEQSFKQLRTLIEEEFPDYRFVPYNIYSSTINGLEVRYGNNEDIRVYHALFNGLFDFRARVIGDLVDFGQEQWLIENPNMKDKWVIYPPLSAMKNKPDNPSFEE